MWPNTRFQRQSEEDSVARAGSLLLLEVSLGGTWRRRKSTGPTQQNQQKQEKVTKVVLVPYTRRLPLRELVSRSGLWL